MKSQLLEFIHHTDTFIAKAALNLYTEKPNLIIFLFHELFLNKAECEKGLMFPHEWLTVDHFRQFVIYFLEAGYTFVSPRKIEEGLDKNGKFVLISFDDGYFNNHRALPVLREFELPAVFSIASDYILNHRAFWWDVHYREERKKGKSFRTLLAEQNELKQLKYDEVERHLKNSYGVEAFKNRSDTDRPFTADELQDFAREKFVHIGNHSRHHAILPHYELKIIHEEIRGAQNDLFAILGYKPDFIAYPNGETNPQVIKIAKEIGLNIGVVAYMNKQFLPLEVSQYLQLDRFQIYGTRNIEEQCIRLRSDFSLRKIWQSIRGK